MNATRNVVSSTPPKGLERRLWFGLLAAPSAWLISEIVGVSVVGRSACESGSNFGTWQWVILLGVTFAAIAFAAAGAIVAYRAFTAWTRRGKLMAAEGWDRVEFMAQFGVFFSVLLLMNIVFFGFIPFLISPCLHTIA